MDNDELFSFLNDDDTDQKDQWLQQKQENYEEKMVKVTLKAFEISKPLWSIKQDCYELTGSKALTFNWFHDAFPGCPLIFKTRSIPYVYKVSIIDLYKRFTNTLIYKEYIACKDSIPSDMFFGYWGMIFTWPELGQMIIHNSKLVTKTTRFEKELPNDQIVYLDILSPMLATLKTVWTPS